MGEGQMKVGVSGLDEEMKLNRGKWNYSAVLSQNGGPSPNLARRGSRIPHLTLDKIEDDQLTTINI